MSSNSFGIANASIASGQSLSNVLDLANYNLAALIMPSGWDAAVITVLAAQRENGTFLPVYDDAGTEVSLTVGASRVVSIDQAAGSLAQLRYIKLRSGNIAAAVNQTAQRDIVLLLK